MACHLRVRARERHEAKRRRSQGEAKKAGTPMSLTLPLLLARSYFVFRIAVPKYRHTLWSWTSGRQCAQAYFLTGNDDEVRFTEIFSMNLLLWESDIGEEVKAWAAANWARWSAEKPAWFKPEMVPDQFIPAGEL